MNLNWGTLLFTCSFFLWPCALAQTADSDKEPLGIVELGGAAGWSLNGGGSSAGLDFAFEFTPIENWLEIEAGTTPLFSRHAMEWDTDLLFKKPWTLSKKLEFMLGVGPEWIHARENGVTANSLGGEIAADLMFWPSASHRFGWFVEPAFDYSFGSGHERSMGVTFGLLIGIGGEKSSNRTAKANR